MEEVPARQKFPGILSWERKTSWSASVGGVLESTSVKPVLGPKLLGRWESSNARPYTCSLEPLQKPE